MPPLELDVAAGLHSVYLVITLTQHTPQTHIEMHLNVCLRSSNGFQIKFWLLISHRGRACQCKLIGSISPGQLWTNQGGAGRWEPSIDHFALVTSQNLNWSALNWTCSRFTQSQATLVFAKRFVLALHLIDVITPKKFLLYNYRSITEGAGKRW